jgi:hypothetical protein
MVPDRAAKCVQLTYLSFARRSAPPYFSGLFCFSSGITDLLLFGIVSRPWSPFASLPPDVDVPLPLLLGVMPVVSEDLEAELAAGRGSPGLRGCFERMQVSRIRQRPWLEKL